MSIVKLNAQKPIPDGVVLTKASDMVSKSIDWIWFDWLARGKLHILAGSPSTGKTTLTMSIASIISTGGNFPDGKPSKYCGDVIIYTSEDSPEDTLKPRLELMGANLDRIHFISEFRENGEKVSFNPSMHFNKLSEQIEIINQGGGNVLLLVVDPIVTAIKGDMNQANGVRAGLQPLVDLGNNYQLATLGISHFGKGTQGRDTVERVLGSQAFGASSRIVWAVAKSSNGERVLVHPKNNIGTENGGFSYTVEVSDLNGCDVTEIVWGNWLDGHAREILIQYETIEDDGNKEKKSALEEAKDFLREILAFQDVPVKDIQEEAKANMISDATLIRARNALGIKTKKGGMKEGWLCCKIESKTYQID
ncbi:AAA family ATPase [Polynucleobacter rarus]|uniref:AAA family ATPase n=1 Tax=Polynucleobacter rarus TaxID=556055 RepID=UPI000D3E1110|nr:AAA family ATPase [Polynucleobacter rarus]